jgi:hypothetical protein
MAALSIKLDFSKFSQDLEQRVERLKNKDYLLRPVAIETIPLMTRRIHQDGVARDGSQIGTYSSSYLKLRQAKYNRSGDPKVIVALTSQLENDWSVIATDKGYAIGFSNTFNLQKARWVEDIKGKIIFSLSEDEQQFVIERFQEMINNALNS